METEKLCTFYIDNLFLGVPVQHVQEVIRYQEMTRVPLAPSVVSGLINLRGQIVTAIDLRRRMALADAPDTVLPINVIVRDDSGMVSLLVDEIGDVLDLSEETFERPPETLTGAARSYVRGVHKLQGQLLLVLDIEKVTHLSQAANA